MHENEKTPLETCLFFYFEEINEKHGNLFIIEKKYKNQIQPKIF